MTADYNKILDRVRKLYAMGTQTEASPHEAAIAMRRAQSLMRKHGITLGELTPDQIQDMQLYGASGDTTTGLAWRRVVAGVVAIMHDCMATASGNAPDHSTVGLRGFTPDLAAGRMTWDFCVSEIERGLEQRRHGDRPAALNWVPHSLDWRMVAGVMTEDDDPDDPEWCDQYRFGFACQLEILADETANPSTPGQSESADDAVGQLVAMKGQLVADTFGEAPKRVNSCDGVTTGAGLEAGVSDARHVRFTKRLS